MTTAAGLSPSKINCHKKQKKEGENSFGSDKTHEANATQPTKYNVVNLDWTLDPKINKADVFREQPGNMDLILNDVLSECSFTSVDSDFRVFRRMSLYLEDAC